MWLLHQSNIESLRVKQNKLTISASSISPFALMATKKLWHEHLGQYPSHIQDSSMANDKVYLVVMVAFLDSSLAIQNILKVLEVLVVMVVLFSGPKPPPFGFNGRPTKIMSTSLGIFVCTLTSCVSLGI